MFRFGSVKNSLNKPKTGIFAVPFTAPALASHNIPKMLQNLGSPRVFTTHLSRLRPYFLATSRESGGHFGGQVGFGQFEWPPGWGPLGMEGIEIVALTDVAVRNAKPGPKPYKMGDSHGLFLLVQPTGGKLWRFKYRVDGREKKLAIGPYPEIGLGEARRRRDEAREAMTFGKDPAREKQREKIRSKIEAENTFAAITAEFCEKRRRDGQRAWAPATAKRCEYLLSILCGSIGTMPIAEIEPADVLVAVRRIEVKGKLESARRTLQLAGSVFRYAVATARLKSDPTRDLKGALTSPTVTHYGAVIDPAGVGELLRSIDGYEGQPITKFAMQLAPHVFVRPGELRHAEWSEIDLEGALWTIPASKTKMRKEHVVPLSRQAIAILKSAHSLTGPSGYVFPSVRTRRRPMSDNTINAGLRRLG